MGKNPKARHNPELAKQPKAVAVHNYHDVHPSWRIRKMELVEPYGWHTLDADGINAVRSRLSDFESMTWGEILVGGRKFHHAVAVEQLCKDARDRLGDLFRGNIDVDELLSLRLSGKERVWGILENGVLSLLWWDPQHQVCPALLRNT